MEFILKNIQWFNINLNNYSTSSIIFKVYVYSKSRRIQRSFYFIDKQVIFDFDCKYVYVLKQK